MPDNEKRFTPSYDVDTQAAYQSVVDECAPWQEIDDWDERMDSGSPPYCKRVRHRMMLGGRRNLRYRDAGWSGGVGLNPYPPDPNHEGPKAAFPGRPATGTLPVTLPGSRVGNKEGPKTQSRLAGAFPHYHMRTQPYVLGRSTLVRLGVGQSVQAGDLSLELIGTGKIIVTKDGTAKMLRYVPRRPMDVFDHRVVVDESPNQTVIARVSDLSVVRKISQVRKALEKYMHSVGLTNQFIMPRTVEALMKSGMPTNIAHLMIQRITPGTVFRPGLSARSQEESAEDFDLFRALASKFMPEMTLEYVDSGKGKRELPPYRLALGPNDILAITGRGVLPDDKENGELEEQPLVSSLQFEGNEIGTYTLTANEIAQAYEKWVGAVKTAQRDEYVASVWNPEFVKALIGGMQESMRDLIDVAQYVGANVEISVFTINRQDGKRSQISIPVRTGEHSKFDEVTPRSEPVKYKNLRNLALEELPVVLVQLSLRKSRVGRKLPIMRNAIQNPQSTEVSAPAVSLPSLRQITLQHVFDQLYNNPSGPKLVHVLDAQGIPVPDRVYWPETKLRSFRLETGVSERKRVPVKLKEVDVAQALSWLKIAKVGRAMQSNMQTAARKEMSSLTPSAPARKNPMSDEDFWLYQYSKSPYGAEKSIPESRRNPEADMYEEEEEEEISLDNPRGRRGRKPKAKDVHHTSMSRRGRPSGDADPLPALPARAPRRPRSAAARKPARRIAAAPAAAPSRSAVAKRAQAILKKKGCDLGSAMRQAWAELSGKAPARGRGRSRSNPWYDSLYLPDTTVVRPALVPSGYSWNDQSMVRSDLVPGPYTRTNPSEFESSPEPALWEYHPVYDTVAGQFSTGESFTRGVQPMNRRNPAGMTARFPGTCVHCGGEIQRGDQIVDSGIRGPQGGKKMAHANCGR